jgi:hypothetical protein
MMIYKYYDTITAEDLEFSVGSKQAVWEVKESLLGPNAGSHFGGFSGGNSHEDMLQEDERYMMDKLPAFSHPQAQQGYIQRQQMPAMPYQNQQQGGYGAQAYPPQKGGQY